MRYLALLLLMCSCVVGQEDHCISLAEDKAMVEKQGAADYLGVTVLPFTEGAVVVYRLRASNFAVFSPVVHGCVVPQTYPLGPFKARTGA